MRNEQNLLKNRAMDLIRDAGMGMEASDYLELLGAMISECIVEIEDLRTRNARKIIRQAIADFQAVLERIKDRHCKIMR